MIGKIAGRVTPNIPPSWRVTLIECYLAVTLGVLGAAVMDTVILDLVSHKVAYTCC